MTSAAFLQDHGEAIAQGFVERQHQRGVAHAEVLPGGDGSQVFQERGGDPSEGEGPKQGCGLNG